MKRSTVFIFCLVFALTGALAVTSALAKGPKEPNQGIGNGNPFFAGKIVVANRASLDISIIDTASDQVINTLNLPDNGQPMYVVYTHVGNRVFVGDRANNRVVVFNADDFSIIDTVPAGNGVFHMWADPQNQQIWVNNDIDNTATVINPRTLQVITTVNMPQDLVSLGGKPHDVVLDTRFAYISIIVAGGQDYVLKFSKRTFAEVDRRPVGDDPHVSLTLRNQFLYVPTQNADEVLVLNRHTFEVETGIPVSDAHGAGMARNGETFYTTNISGSELVTIDTQTNAVVGTPVAAPAPIAHNIALTPNGQKIYVTHSGGTADQVTVYTATQQNPVPVFETAITVGTNPFGLAFVP